MEEEKSDEAIKWLFLVSAGAAAATLTYIGNLTKDGTSVPSVAFTMLGLFGISLLLVGLIRAIITIRLELMFSKWRHLVAKYYSDQNEWDNLTDPKIEYRWSLSLIHFLYVASFVLLASGFIYGFSKLQEESERVGKEKTSQKDGPVRSGTNDSEKAPSGTRGGESGAELRKREVRDEEQKRPEEARNISGSINPSTKPEEKPAR